MASNHHRDSGQTLFGNFVHISGSRVILLSQRGPAAPVKLADLRNFPHTGLPRATACYAIDLRCLYRGFERPIVGEAVHQRCDQLNRSAFHTLASALKE